MSAPLTNLRLYGNMFVTGIGINTVLDDSKVLAVLALIEVTCYEFSSLSHGTEHLKVCG